MITRVCIAFCSALLAVFFQGAACGQATSVPAAPPQASAVPPAQQPSTAGAAQTAKNIPFTAWTILKDGTASDKMRDRSDALSALTLLDRDSRAIGMIEAALDDKEVSIRFLAATVLGSMHARPAIPRLRKALDDESVEVSFAAAQSLWQMGDRSGREILYQVLDGERKTKPGLIQSKINSAKKDMHDPKAMTLIGINEASGALLGPFSMGVSFIEEAAKNNGAPVQALCAELLASDNSPGTIDELTDALSDKNWAVRVAAARSLAKLNHAQAVRHLKELMDTDKDQPARFAAAAAIIRLTEHRSTPSSPAAAPSPANPASSANPAAK